MKIVYENEWDRSVVHADIEFPYEEDYQMMMLRHNDFKFLVKITGTGREGKSRYTFYPGNALSLEKQYGKQAAKALADMIYQKIALALAAFQQSHIFQGS